jgi:hypothetical protein
LTTSFFSFIARPFAAWWGQREYSEQDEILK